MLNYINRTQSVCLYWALSDTIPPEKKKQKRAATQTHESKYQ